jgi:hypothetical protein
MVSCPSLNGRHEEVPQALLKPWKKASHPACRRDERTSSVMCKQNQAGVESPRECSFDHDKISQKRRLDSFPGVQL